MGSSSGVAAVVGMLILLVAQMVIQHWERRDLYNRLMSRGLSEYQRSGAKETEDVRETAHERAIKKWRSGRSD